MMAPRTNHSLQDSPLLLAFCCSSKAVRFVEICSRGCVAHTLLTN